MLSCRVLVECTLAAKTCPIQRLYAQAGGPVPLVPYLYPDLITMYIFLPILITAARSGMGPQVRLRGLLPSRAGHPRREAPEINLRPLCHEKPGSSGSDPIRRLPPARHEHGQCGRGNQMQPHGGALSAGLYRVDQACRLCGEEAVYRDCGHGPDPELRSGKSFFLSLFLKCHCVATANSFPSYSFSKPTSTHRSPMPKLREPWCRQGAASSLLAKRASMASSAFC